MAEQLCSKVDSIAYVMNKEIYYNEKKFKVFKFNGLPKEEIFAVYNIKHNKYVDEFINILQK